MWIRSPRGAIVASLLSLSSACFIAASCGDSDDAGPTAAPDGGGAGEAGPGTSGDGGTPNPESDASTTPMAPPIVSVIEPEDSTLVDMPCAAGGGGGHPKTKAEIVYDSNRVPDAGACVAGKAGVGGEKVHIDSPVRAFADTRQRQHLIVSDPLARGIQWTGTAAEWRARPPNPRLDCTPVMAGERPDAGPSDFDQKTWIEALYVQPSTNTVFAYGHNDWWGRRTNNPGCRGSSTTVDAGFLQSCWYASVPVWSSAVAANGRMSFARAVAPPNHVAIYPYAKYPGDRDSTSAGWIGYGMPSNLVRGRTPDGALDGFYYLFAKANVAYEKQERGHCLFRSDNPADVTSWRVWSRDPEKAFRQQITNPYGPAINLPCDVLAVVGDDLAISAGVTLRSIVWHRLSRQFIGIIEGAFDYGDAGPIAGFHTVTSPNLVTWSPPRLLVRAPTRVSATLPDIAYASFIDHSGGQFGDATFDRLYSNNEAYVYYRYSVCPNHTQIRRAKVRVENYPPDPPSEANR